MLNLIMKFKEYNPDIKNGCFIADNAYVIGQVKICEDANIWFGAVLRSDTNSIYVGKSSNIQDNCTVHVDTDSSVHIGNYVTIGHNSVIHGCTIGDCTLIGMGSIIMNGATIGSETIIGAGSLVTENKNIPSGVLCMGSPAKVVRKLTEEEKKGLKRTAESYVKESKEYN